MLHYRHPEDCDKRCHCPRCGWSGTLHQTDEYTPEGGESFQVCPRCGPEVPVIPGELTTSKDDMSMYYYIKTGPTKYWKPKGYGYTDRREEAGVFTIREMEAFNLDGCSLERAEVPSGLPDTDTTGRA